MVRQFMLCTGTTIFGIARFRMAVLTVLPSDAKWIWRWTNPVVAYYPGELTVTNANNSTYVQVIES